ncbi:MAG: hypothetical protein V4550_02835 [Gemmatimonadota bacterium]
MTWSRRDFVRVGLGAAAGNMLLGCGATEPNTVARLMSRPGTPSITPTRGLTQLGLGGDRDGVLYVPESYDASVPAGLFVALHGAGGSSSNWPSYYARAEARKMIFMAPSSRESTWDLLRDKSVGPDLEFIDRALAHTFARCRIDPRRICLGGFSDGATYALALGLPNGDLFSHLAIYSAGFLAEADKLYGKPRVFVSHGTNDPVLSFETSRDVIMGRLGLLGYDATFFPFAGGHEVPSAVSDAALTWFYS